MAARQPLLNFLPLLFSLLSFVLILLILLAGTNNALPDLYYLRTDTSSLSVPSKLSSSTFLADLSAVSGADLTGQRATASSLGIAESYTILLLTSCAHFPTSVICGKPHVGFSFNPASELRLDSTSLQGTFPPALVSALSSYQRSNPFLANGYIVSAALVALAPVVGSLLGTRHRWAGHAAAALSSLAGGLILASSAAAVVTFRRLDEQINSAFNSSGLHSEVGVVPVALGFVAFVFSLLTSIILIIRARSPVAPRGRMVTRSIGTEYDDSVSKPSGVGSVEGISKRSGLWKRMPTWKNHKYVQVEKQPTLLKTTTGVGSLEAVVVTSPAGTRTVASGDDDEWDGADEYTGRAGGGGNGIPMLSLGNKRERDVGSAYEPYSGSHGGV
jgi:hypothetical protein